MRDSFALAAACLAALMFGLEISSVPVVLPTLGRELHADFGDLQWIMNAYTVACTTVLMAAGTLADRFGRRRVFVLSLVVFGIASLACGLARDSTTLILARAAQGIGGGSMLICLIAVLSQRFTDGRERSRAFAIWGIVFGTGLGLGPVIGGLIVSLLGWRWVFLVHAPITALTLGLVFVTIKESRDPRAQRLDIAGVILLSLTVLGLVSFTMALQQPGPGSPGLIGLAVVTLVSLGLFVVAERRKAYPMFDFSVLRIRRFSGAILGSVGVNFCFWPLMIYLPIYFQNALGYDSTTTGLALLAYTLPVLLLPPLGEHLALRYQPHVIIPAGLSVTGLGFLLMTWGNAVHVPSWLTLLPGCLLAGAGVGLANSPITNTATGAVPPGRAGMASGIDMTARLVTLAINIALMGLILSQAGGVADASALQHGFGLVLIYGGLGAWALAAASYRVLR